MALLCTAAQMGVTIDYTIKSLEGFAALNNKL
jgi:hypothetical protein